MISVPSSLKTQIQKLRGRRLQARCRIDYSDATIDNTIIAWSNGTENNTYLDQVYNGIEDISAKFASLDGSWVLGEYALAPETASEQALLEIGAWSKILSNPDGTFHDSTDAHFLHGKSLYGSGLYGGSVSAPELSVNFTPRTISDIRISFDNAREEYAIDFDVVFYDIDYAIMYTLQVRGNAGLKYVNTITTQNAVAQMTIRFLTWSNGGRQAKLAEMYTSISELYNGSDIMNLQVVENREIPEDGVPLGSTASGQCVLSIYNRDRKFDYDNTTSKLYNVVRKGVRVLPEIGDGTNWIPLGVFYAQEWDIDKRSITATVTCVDRMALLADSEYKVNKIIEAPADQSYLTDTDAEWNSATLEGVYAISNTLKMAVS